jgi:hypothetical protein
MKKRQCFAPEAAMFFIRTLPLPRENSAASTKAIRLIF